VLFFSVSGTTVIFSLLLGVILTLGHNLCCIQRLGLIVLTYKRDMHDPSPRAQQTDTGEPELAIVCA